MQRSPGKIDARWGCPLVTRSSQPDVTLLGRERLRDQQNSQNNQKNRPQIREAVSAVFSRKKNHPDRDHHHGTDQAFHTAVRASAFRRDSVRHSSLLRRLLEAIPREPHAESNQRNWPRFLEPLAIQKIED